MEIKEQYLQALLAQPAVSTITLADGSSVRVEDVYLPRTLLHEVKQKKSEQDPDRGSQGREGATAPKGEITVKLPVELWPKLDKERVVVVEGPAGIGKSTLTKQLVRESRAHYPIPIWIAFRPFVASGLSIADYLDQYYVPWLGLAGLRVPYQADRTGPDRSLGQWLYEQWKDGFGGLLIIDGLDEVFQYDERVTALQGLPITRPGATRPATILTSRPLSQSLPLQMAKVEVQGLTPSEQIQFVEQYRASLQLTEDQVTHFTNAMKKQEQGRLRELLTRPGHLIQILTTYSRTNTLLDTETAVVDELLNSRLTITGRSEPPVEGDDREKKRQLLGALALHLLACRQGQRHTRAQLLALIQQVLREQATHGTPLFLLSQATALLNDFMRNSALLSEVEPDVYEFETVIWLQYLTGTALASSETITALNLTNTQVLEFLDKKAWDPEWEPVLMSWVRNSKNPFPLLKLVTGSKQDDLARHRLGTAGRCLVEVKPSLRIQQEYQAFSVQIPTEAFERWRVEAETRTEDLLETSLRGAWVKTQVGEAKLMQLKQLLASDQKDPWGEAEWMMNAIERSLSVGKDQGLPQATMALERLGFAMTINVQQTLLEQLQDKNVEVRRMAAESLEGLGSAVSTTVQQTLMSQLGDTNERVRMTAALALGKLDSAMSVAVQQALISRLEDGNRVVQTMAAEALGRLGGAMPTAVQQTLMRRLEEGDDYVRFLAIVALGKLGPAMPATVQQALMRWLEDGDEGDRRAAGEALGGLGSAMSAAVQRVLMNRLEDEDEAVRRAAVEALGGLGLTMSPTVQRALMSRLEDENIDVQRWAIEALGRTGSAMSAAVQKALMARLEDPRTRRHAVWAILSAQQQGLRFFPQSAVSPGWLVTELSATTLFTDGCNLTIRGSFHSSLAC